MLKIAKNSAQQNKENGSSNVSQAVPLKKPSKYIAVRSGFSQFEVSSFDKSEKSKKLV